MHHLTCQKEKPWVNIARYDRSNSQVENIASFLTEGHKLLMQLMTREEFCPTTIGAFNITLFNWRKSTNRGTEHYKKDNELLDKYIQKKATSSNSSQERKKKLDHNNLPHQACTLTKSTNGTVPNMILKWKCTINKKTKTSMDSSDAYPASE